jgi:hypothetical protein
VRKRKEYITLYILTTMTIILIYTDHIKPDLHVLRSSSNPSPFASTGFEPGRKWCGLFSYDISPVIFICHRGYSPEYSLFISWWKGSGGNDIERRETANPNFAAVVTVNHRDYFEAQCHVDWNVPDLVFYIEGWDIYTCVCACLLYVYIYMCYV